MQEVSEVAPIRSSASLISSPVILRRAAMHFSAPQHHVLHPAHVAMWRTEQVGMDQLVCFVRIGQIVLASVFESPDMVKSMISQTMSPFYNHLEFLGMLAHIVAHQKEGSLDIVLV